MPSLAFPGSAEKKQQSKNAQLVRRLLAAKLESLGFAHTKPSFFTRSASYVIEFVHVHKYTFGPSFRLHLGVRVRSDDFDAAHLNGPCADGIDGGPGDTDLDRFEFTSAPADIESCARAMAIYVSTTGTDWFESLKELPTLLAPGSSPLSGTAMAALMREVANGSHSAASKQTLHALNAA